MLPMGGGVADAEIRGRLQGDCHILGGQKKSDAGFRQGRPDHLQGLIGDQQMDHGIARIKVDDCGIKQAFPLRSGFDLSPAALAIA